MFEVNELELQMCCSDAPGTRSLLSTDFRASQSLAEVVTAINNNNG